jgi:hypothetical protein
MMAQLKQLLFAELAKKDYHLLGLTQDNAHLNDICQEAGCNGALLHHHELGYALIWARGSGTAPSLLWGRADGAWAPAR